MTSLRSILAIGLTAAVVAGGVAALPTGSRAAALDEMHAQFRLGLRLMHLIKLRPLRAESPGDSSSAESTGGQAATFRMINFNAGTEPGEPLFGGRMKKTVWGKFTPARNQRIVLHTFGSDYDTVLAVHTGNAVNKLKKVALNDDYPVAGLSLNASLVQVDARKGVSYSVQIGSKTGAEGDVYASISVFPPSGGLTAHLAAVDGTPWQGRDYVCQRGAVSSPTCGAPSFLLHNSTGRRLRITAASDLDPAFKAPDPVTLKPGEAKLVAFAVEGLDTSSPRTVSGHFTFVASSGKTVVSTAKVGGLVVVKAGGAPEALTVEVLPQARAGYANAANTFQVKLTNTGSSVARGCHARSQYLGFVAGRTAIGWRPVNAAGKPVAPAGRPFGIPPGKTKWMSLVIASQQPRVADLTTPIPIVPEVVIDCNNTAPAVFDNKSRFDLTARGGWEPADVVISAVAPKGDTLDVPRNGNATWRVSVENKSATAPLIVWPSYVRPFDDSDPNRQFSVSVCRTKFAGSPCLNPLADTVEFEAASGKKAFFLVNVRGPKTDPGFDPTLRRVFLIVSQKKPDGYVGTSRPPVAARSIAPKRS